MSSTYDQPYSEALSIIRFLTYYWDPSVVENPQLLIINPVPSLSHIGLIGDLFPEATIHCYSREGGTITNGTLYVQTFSDDDALQWSGRDDVIVVYNPIPVDDELLLWKQYGLMKTRLTLMNPMAAMIRFRPPYPSQWEEILRSDISLIEGVPDVRDPTQVNYLSGVMFSSIPPGEDYVYLCTKDTTQRENTYDILDFYEIADNAKRTALNADLILAQYQGKYGREGIESLKDMLGSLPS